MSIKLKCGILLTLLATTFMSAAEDIDIYSANQSDGSHPNLLFLLDNSGGSNANATFSCPELPALADTTKAFGFEQCALYKSANAIGSSTSLLGSINMGLMYYNHFDGGKMKYPSTPTANLPTMDAAGISGFKSVIAGMSLANDSQNSNKMGQMMQEAWAYYAGSVGVSGQDYVAKHFNSACQRNFVVVIANATTNGGPGGSWGSPTPQTKLNDAGATTEQQTEIDSITGVSNNDMKQWAAEWSNFMFQTDMSPGSGAGSFAGQQNITTYTIIVTDGHNSSYVSLLQAMASYGGGKSFVVTLGDMDSLVSALLQIFNEVQGVNSAFSSSSLPVSANAQGEYLNQVFMGVFRPDASPRWQGNLKQYKLGVNPNNTAETMLVDSNGNDAISSAGTGFISPNAVSFWTSFDGSTVPDSLGGFWFRDPQGAAGGYDFKDPGDRTKGRESPGDGEIVEKGGAHQRTRLTYQHVDYNSTAENSVPLPSTARQLYTCTTGCSNGTALKSTPFSLGNSDITSVLLGSSSPAINIASIVRDDTTNRATVTLASTPSPALVSGQTVVISGAANTAFNGSFSITVIDAMHFYYPLSTSLITPPTPATGSYSITSTGTSITITSLTRSGTTVTAVTSAAHGFVAGQKVTITGASTGYNGSYVVTPDASDLTKFTYTVIESPITGPTSGGTAWNAASASGTKKFTFAATDVQIFEDASGTSKTVTINGKANDTKGWGTTLTISGVTPSDYNITNATALHVGSDGASCLSGSGSLKAQKDASLCYTINTTPTSPAAQTGTATTSGLGSIALSAISRSSSSCVVSVVGASYVSSGSANATATGTFASPVGVSTGTFVVNVTGAPAVGEDNYVKTNATITVTSNTTFTYPITLAPACSDSSSGMKATPYGVDRDSLVRWIRGEDNVGDEASPDRTHASINIRPSVHGDVLHSRPIIINYGLGDIDGDGSNDNVGVVAFYGSNDGVFRAVNGNRTNPASSAMPSPGNELWGFIPSEFFSRLNRLRSNSPQIKLLGTPNGIIPEPQPKDYFFDGSTGAYQNITTKKAYIYLSARRGGRLIYALDVSDPRNPKFMWKHAGSDTRFAELGQTWSQPKVIKVQGYSNPVIVMGAGYDTHEDSQPATTDTMGRGIFILDAVTGDIVWQARGGGGSNHCSGTSCLLMGMTYAIPSDVATLDRDKDGYIDRLYVPDLGGNIWRVDLEPSVGHIAPADWQATLFASVGGAASGADKRKIFYPPSIVPTLSFDAVMVATGDREHPTASDAAASIKNRLYMLKDINIGKDGSKAADGSDWSPILDDSSTTSFQTASMLFNATGNTLYDGSLSGFYLNLANVTGGVAESGEKAVNAPVTVAGTTYFATNTPVAPNAASCQANLGTARGYAVDFFTGSASSITFPGGGLPPTAVVATVTLDNGVTRQVCIGCGEGAQGLKGAPGAGNTGGPTNAPRKRSFWYEKR